MNGEIQIIPYGNSMKIDCDMSAASTLWKAIMPNGNLVEPGTAGTLKIDRTSASDATPKISTTVTTQTTDSNDTNCIFKNLAAASGVSIPKLLVALGLFPDSGASYGNDHFGRETTAKGCLSGGRRSTIPLVRVRPLLT